MKKIVIKKVILIYGLFCLLFDRHGITKPPYIKTMFNNFNFLDLAQKLKQFQEFKKQLQQSGIDPRELLKQEIEKRNLSPDQLKNLEELARGLKDFIK